MYRKAAVPCPLFVIGGPWDWVNSYPHIPTCFTCGHRAEAHAHAVVETFHPAGPFETCPVVIV